MEWWVAPRTWVLLFIPTIGDSKCLGTNLGPEHSGDVSSRSTGWQYRKVGSRHFRLGTGLVQTRKVPTKIFSQDDLLPEFSRPLGRVFLSS